MNRPRLSRVLPLVPLVLLLVAVAGAASAQPAGRWERLPNAPALGPGERYDDVFFIDPQTGWIVNLSQGAVFGTTDGGATWTKQLDSRAAFGYQALFRTIGFADARVGWAGTLSGERGNGDPSPNTRLLFETRDGGATWENITGRIQGALPSGLCGLYVVNARVAYGVGRYGIGPDYLLKTTDGGRTWTSKDLTPLAGLLIDVYFFDEHDGIAIGGTKVDGWEALETVHAVVLGTTDGGETWHVRHETGEAHEYGWKISFPTRDVGYVSLQGPKPGVLKTTDGGRTWQELRAATHVGGLSAVGFADAQTGWISGGTTSVTTDGGATWRPAGFEARLNRIRMLGDTLGYGVGDGVYRFTRAGGTASEPPAAPWPFALEPGYPNPFNPSTTLRFTLDAPGPARLVVYDTAGRAVATLVDGFRAAGRHEVAWHAAGGDGRRLASGPYVARLEAAGRTRTTTLVLLK